LFHYFFILSKLYFLAPFTTINRKPPAKAIFLRNDVI